MNNDGTRKWYIDESLKNVRTTAQLPLDTIANCLLMIANAGRCVLYQDRGGTLRIERANNTVTDYKISRFNSYSKPEITLTKPVKEIAVRIYQYNGPYRVVDNLAGGQTVTIDDDGMDSNYTEILIPVGNVGERITIDNPLITDENVAHDVGVWVSECLQRRLTLDTVWRADTRLDVLDVVKTENDFGENDVRMTEIEFIFNGAFRGKGKGRVIG